MASITYASVDEAHALLRAGARAIDASWTTTSDAASAADEDDKDGFHEERLPGAVFYDHNAFADLSSPLPQAFPAASELGGALGRTLGLSRKDDVVVYARTSRSFAAEACANVLLEHGHEGAVRVLRGGLEAWVEARPDDVERGADGAKTYPAVEYGASDGKQRATTYVNAKDLLQNLSTQRLQVLDCRQKEVFEGAMRDSAYLRIQGRVKAFDGFREGHIPGAKNLHYVQISKSRLYDDFRRKRAVLGTYQAFLALGSQYLRFLCPGSILLIFAKSLKFGFGWGR